MAAVSGVCACRQCGSPSSTATKGGMRMGIHNSLGNGPHNGLAIEAEGLTKRFGTTQALDGVDLAAREGTVLGVLGPNGAGKTTAVRVLATLLRADTGQAQVCGYDVARQAHQVRQLIGLTGQYASVDNGLSGVNNLIMIGRLLGQSRRQ